MAGPNQQPNGFGTPRPVSYDSYMGDNPPVAPPDDNLLCLEFQNNGDNGKFIISIANLRGATLETDFFRNVHETRSPISIGHELL